MTFSIWLAILLVSGSLTPDAIVLSGQNKVARPGLIYVSECSPAGGNGWHILPWNGSIWFHIK